MYHSDSCRIRRVILTVVVLPTGPGVRKVSLRTPARRRILTGVAVIWVWDRSVSTVYGRRLVTVTLVWVEMVTVGTLPRCRGPIETFIEPATVHTVREEFETLSRTVDITVRGGSHSRFSRSVGSKW